MTKRISWQATTIGFGNVASCPALKYLLFGVALFCWNLGPLENTSHRLVICGLFLCH